MSLPKYVGQTVNLGGVDYTIPPLSLGQVRRLQDRMNNLYKMKDTASIAGIPSELADDMVAIIHAAMSRNYPDITEDFVLENLDLGNMVDITKAVMGLSGLKKAVAGLQEIA